MSAKPDLEKIVAKTASDVLNTEIKELLDWAESIICNGSPLPHCTAADWEDVVRKWRDKKHSLFPDGDASSSRTPDNPCAPDHAKVKLIKQLCSHPHPPSNKIHGDLDLAGRVFDMQGQKVDMEWLAGELYLLRRRREAYEGKLCMVMDCVTGAKSRGLFELHFKRWCDYRYGERASKMINDVLHVPFPHTLLSFLDVGCDVALLRSEDIAGTDFPDLYFIDWSDFEINGHGQPFVVHSERHLIISNFCGLSHPGEVFKP